MDKLSRAKFILNRNGGAIMKSEFKVMTSNGFRYLPIPEGFHEIAAKDAKTEAGRKIVSEHPKARIIVERNI